jgi:hypothetical protein
MKPLFTPPLAETTLRNVLSGLSLLALTGCATTSPVLLQSEKSPSAVQQAERAITQCQEAADRDVGRNAMTAPAVSKKLGKTGAVEFADAYVDNAIRKGSGAARRAAGAAAGGVTGLATKLVLEWNEPDRVHQKHVEHCLEKRGHRVLGWR